MKDTRFKVVEMFSSIDGEGLRAGLPVTFIRLHGCNLKCSYCDSQYACAGNDFIDIALEDIIKTVESFGIKAITLTGGEPLLHDSVYDLIEELLNRNYWVNIETNGSIDLKYLDGLRQVHYYVDFQNRIHKLMITMDYKCESSGMSDKMKEENFKYLRKGDVLKFVVGDQNDLFQMKTILTNNQIKANVFVSPVFGKIEAKEIVEYLLAHELYDVRVQLQLHKIIYDPTMRGV